VGQTGDVIVGRVNEVGSKRWKIDIQGPQEAILQLSSVNLPNNQQRRRNAEDQLQMRSFFAEDDLVSCEVQEAKRDGQVMLHTRSNKYGKLVYGTLVRVLPSLMKRLPQHFQTLPCGVNAIFGMNGFIWLSPPDESEAETAAAAAIEGSASAMELDAGMAGGVDAMSWRERVCRVRNAIVILAADFAQISPSAIMAIYEESLTQSMHPKHILDQKHSEMLVKHARAATAPGATK